MSSGGSGPSACSSESVATAPFHVIVQFGQHVYTYLQVLCWSGTAVLCTALVPQIFAGWASVLLPHFIKPPILGSSTTGGGSRGGQEGFSGGERTSRGPAACFTHTRSLRTGRGA